MRHSKSDVFDIINAKPLDGEIRRTVKGMEIFGLFGKRVARLLGGAQAVDDESGVYLERIEPLHILKGCAVAAFSAVLGISSGIFSCYPFGLGFLCAADKYVPYCFGGLVVSSLSNKGYAPVLAVMYTLSLLLRYSLGRLAEEEVKGERGKYRRKAAVRFASAINKYRTGGAVFEESVLIRCAVSGFGAFVFGLYRLIAGGFLYYDLFGLISGALLTPLVTLVLFPIFSLNDRTVKYREASRAVLMFIFVLSLKEVAIAGFTPSFSAALFITFWAAFATGSMRGCTVGLFAGFACGNIGADKLGSLAYSLGAAPCILALAGLAFGAAGKGARLKPIVFSSAAVLFLGLTVDGHTVLLRLVTDVFVASAAFLLSQRLGVLPNFPVFVSARDPSSDDCGYIITQKHNDSELRIAALSEAFAQLSETVYALSDKMRRPGVIDLKTVCTDAFDSYCRRCSMASRCLEKDCASTLDAQSKLTAELYSKGRVSIDDVPKFLRERCYNILPIIRAVNSQVGRLTEELIRNDKTEAFAIDYDVMSGLLASQLSVNEEEYKIDEELTDKLRRTAEHFGFPVAGAFCYGTRKKQVVISGVEMIRLKMNTAELKRAVENTVGIPMCEPQFGLEDDIVTVTMVARRRYKVDVAKASGIKENENANGDSAIMFENREDYFYSLISDGMGSGREAAITSKICVTFAKKMLAAGNGKALTLKMLNGFIKSRGTECSATVDLAEIDLINGTACFVKSGAAPSYVVRTGSLYKLESNTAPIGIMDEIDAEKIKFDLKDGDVLVMMTDGVTESLEDGVWLANLITYEWDERLDVMAEKILDNAVLSNKRSDDMTVVLVRVSENVNE